jgi:spermidine synthase
MSEERIRESAMTDLWNVWFCEMHKNRVGLNLKVKRFVHTGESPFQEINIIETHEFGRMLVLYGSIMTTEKDEFIYHEMLSHVPLGAHPAPRSVLIIGGGDGGTLREVLKHPQVEQVTLVEIDRMVVETCKQFLPTIATSFDHPKARILFEDGDKYLASCPEQFDVILVDASDPVGPAEVLFQKPFHQNAARCLRPDGIFATQSESPWYHQKTVRALYRNLSEVFPIVRLYHAYVPTYPSGIWSFTFCSKQYGPFDRFDPADARWEGMKTRYYNGEVHRAAFALPNFIKELTEPGSRRRPG